MGDALLYLSTTICSGRWLPRDIRIVRPLLALILSILAGAAPAQDIRAEVVRFVPGETGATISDRITGYDTVVYSLGAEAGQRMRIELEPTNLQTYFNVYAPGSGPGDQALAVSQFTSELISDLNVFDGTLPTSGIYSISVYMMRAAARRDETSDFTLSVSVTGALGDVVEGDFADGLQGGPDFYQVSVSGGGLNLRADPSTGAAILTRLNNGETLRNLGCRMAEARRWCRVATASGAEGWASGDFLVEGSDPNAILAPGPACLTAVVGETNNNDVTVIETRATENGTEVIVGVGPQRARWSCTAFADGSTSRPMYLN